MFEYWILTIEGYSPDSPFSGKGQSIMDKINQAQFGYLSEKDKQLIFDAVTNECIIFLTVENKLPKNNVHIKNKLGINILRPFDYLEIYLK